MLYSAKKFDANELKIGNVLLKGMDFKNLKGYSDFACVVSRYITMNKEMCNDINTLLKNILSKMKAITELYYSEEKYDSYDTYFKYCTSVLKEINNKISLEDYNDMFLIINNENITSVNDSLLKEYCTVAIPDDGEDATEELMYQLNHIKISININYKIDFNIGKGRITDTNLDVDLANAWNMYKNALEYMFNCYSFKVSNELKTFDKIEINRYIQYADCIIERFLKTN